MVEDVNKNAASLTEDINTVIVLCMLINYKVVGRLYEVNNNQSIGRLLHFLPENIT